MSSSSPERKEKGKWVLFAVAAAFTVLFVVSPLLFYRHFLPLSVLASLFGGLALGRLVRCGRKVAVAAVLFLGAFALLHAITIASIFSTTDVRDEAARWIRDNVPAGAMIAVPSPRNGRAYYTPPIDTKIHPTVVTGFEPVRLAAYDPEILMIADVEIAIPDYSIGDRIARSRFLEQIGPGGSYKKTLTFERPIRFGPIPFTWKLLPSDYGYFRPTITIYSRTERAPWKDRLAETDRLVREKGTDAALEALERLVASGPAKVPLLLRLAELRHRSGASPEEVIAPCEKALLSGIEERGAGPVHETLVDLYRRSGDDAMSAGRPRRAEEAYAAAIRHLTWIRENSRGKRIGMDVDETEKMIRRLEARARAAGQTVD